MLRIGTYEYQKYYKRQLKKWELICSDLNLTDGNNLRMIFLLQSTENLRFRYSGYSQQRPSGSILIEENTVEIDLQESGGTKADGGGDCFLRRR